MLFVSTRGKTDLVCSAHAITRGLADDGGLFVPQKFPELSLGEIVSMRSMTYKERAVAILSLFLTDYTKEELFECADAAYSQTKFGAEPVPLRKVNESTDVLELWHGPTSAFKDMALQILPHLLTKAIAKTGESNKVVILVATSGDTGKAALEGFANVKDTEIIVFYPEDGVSAIQKRQMLTQAVITYALSASRAILTMLSAASKSFLAILRWKRSCRERAMCSARPIRSTGGVWYRRSCIISALTAMLWPMAVSKRVKRSILRCRPAISVISWPAIMPSLWGCRWQSLSALPTAIMF